VINAKIDRLNGTFYRVIILPNFALIGQIFSPTLASQHTSCASGRL